MKSIKKKIWVKGLQLRLRYYQARNVEQKQEIRRLKQALRESGKYVSFIEYIRNKFNCLKYFLWKK